MVALQERNEKDELQHIAEMKDLNRRIAHDDKIKEFMMIKSDDRAELKAEEAAKKEKMKGSVFFSVLFSLTEFEIQSLKKLGKVCGSSQNQWGKCATKWSKNHVSLIHFNINT